MIRRTIVPVLALALLVLGGTAQAERSPEELQALFIANVLKFVEWPDARFEGAEAPIVVGVLGGDPLGGALERHMVDRKVNGRSVEVRAIAGAGDAAECHLVLIGETRRGALRRIAKQLSNTGAISIAKSASFASDGGVVGYQVKRRKVQFEINNETAKKNELKISSRLLQLASAVY